MTDDVAMSDGSDVMTGYTFPTTRLKTRQAHPDREPLILVACGSFSPITNLHLRMFETAADYCRFNTSFEIMGGYLSPVGDAYKKAGLVAARHRLRMCEVATEEDSDWLMVDPWEAMREEYTPTAKVLDHFAREVNEVMGGVEGTDGVKRPVRIALLAGADLIQTMVCYILPFTYIHAAGGGAECSGLVRIDTNPHSPVHTRRLVAKRLGAYSRPLRHLHRRAQRHRHRQRLIVIAAMEREHLGYPADHPERRELDQDQTAAKKRNECEVLDAQPGYHVYQGEWTVRGGGQGEGLVE